VKKTNLTILQIIFFILFLFFVNTSAEELLNTGYDKSFQLLETEVNPRLIAMGTAGTALGERGFFYYNPAQPGMLQKRYLGVEFGLAPGDYSGAVFETGFTIKNFFVAAAFTPRGVKDIIPASETGISNETSFAWQHSMVPLTVGYAKGPVSVGICFYGLQERIGTATGKGFTLSAGLIWKIMEDRLHIGAAGFYPVNLTTTRGMVASTKEWGKGSGINRIGRVGAAWQDSIKEFPYTVLLDLVYNDAFESISMPLGLEFKPISLIALRLGKDIGFDESTGEADVFNFGIGFNVAPLALDISFVVTNHVDDAGIKPTFGLVYTLPGKKSRPE